MKSPPRLAGPDVGPLDFLHALNTHKKHWFDIVQSSRRSTELELLCTSFVKTWNSIKTAFDNKDTAGLKEMQSHLAPWPPVVLLALEPQHSTMVHAAWQTLLEFHTCARMALETPELMALPGWKSWRMALHERQWPQSFSFPGSTDVPGVLRGGSTVALVTTQPFAFVGAQALQKIQQQHKDALHFRFQSPACGSFDTSYQLASEDLFGAHSNREISKLAFWSMVGTQKEHDTANALAWRPRYYGGPQGTPSWALHDAANLTGQSAAKARTAMMDWMTALSDSLHEQLYLRGPGGWTTAHQDFLQAYSRSWHAVTRIGIAHKRTSAQVNELIGYTTSIQIQLERTKNPVAAELAKVIQWTTNKMQQTGPQTLDLALN